MLFLLLAIFSSTMVSVMMRLSSHKVSGSYSVLAFNYLSCSLLGAGYTGFQLIPRLSGFSLTLVLGLSSGVLYLAALVMFQSNTRKRGVVLPAVFMKLGLLVPMAASTLLFGEFPTAVQIVGFVIALGAIVLINFENGSGSFGFGLIVMLLLSGGADVMAKFFDAWCPQSLSGQYLFYTFFTAFALCMGLVLRDGERPGLQELLYGTLIGIPNFFSAKFLLASLNSLPAVVVYPSFSVGTLLLVTLTGVAVFRERLRRHQWVALVAILAALILLNI